MDERIGWALAVVLFVLLVIGIGALSKILAISGPFTISSTLSIPSVKSADNESGRRSVYTLKAANGSGQFGQALVTELAAGKTRITLDLDGAPEGASEPASLNLGKCPRVGEVKFPLNPVSAGHSETILNASYSQLVSYVPFAISIRSGKDPKLQVACGEVRAPAPLSAH